MYQGFSRHINVQDEQVEVFFLPQNTTSGIVYNVFCSGSDVFTLIKADHWQFTERLNGLLAGQEQVVISALQQSEEV